MPLKPLVPPRGGAEAVSPCLRQDTLLPRRLGTTEHNIPIRPRPLPARKAARIEGTNIESGAPPTSLSTDNLLPFPRSCYAAVTGAHPLDPDAMEAPRPRPDNDSDSDSPEAYDPHQTTDRAPTGRDLLGPFTVTCLVLNRTIGRRRSGRGAASDLVLTGAGRLGNLPRSRPRGRRHAQRRRLPDDLGVRRPDRHLRPHGVAPAGPVATAPSHGP